VQSLGAIPFDLVEFQAFFFLSRRPSFSHEVLLKVVAAGGEGRAAGAHRRLEDRPLASASGTAATPVSTRQRRGSSGALTSLTSSLPS